MAILTDLRQSVKNAIDNTASLATVFKRKWYFEDVQSIVDEAGRPIPAFGDLPALMVYPTPSQVFWGLNQAQEIQYVLQIDLWTRFWKLNEAEDYWEKLVKGLFQTASGVGQTPYIHAACGQFPLLGPMSMQLAYTSGDEEGPGPPATVWSQTVTLRYKAFNPRTQA